jgi:hypothetical protein
MEFVVGLVGLLVFALVYSEARSRWAVYALKRNHIASLTRLDGVFRVSLPPVAGELVSAAIDEELDGI